jgi:hypothetical protein
MSQTVMVFADSTARAAAITSPQQGMVSFLKGTNSTEYYNGSTWTAIGGGGGGKVLQVVAATTTTSTAISGTTLADTTLTATITPSASTSKVLILVQQAFEVEKSASTGYEGVLRLLRGSTSIDYPVTFSHYMASSSALQAGETVLPLHYLDSPATTSATTYKTQAAGKSTGNTVYAQNGSTMSTIILMEIGA